MRAWVTFRFLLGYLSYGLSHLFCVLTAAPLIFLLWPFPGLKHRLLERFTRGYFRFFAHGYLPVLGIYRVAEITGLEKSQARPALFVSNHRSYMDSLLLLGLLPRTSVLVKSRYARQPAIGFMARHFDIVSVDADRPSSILASMEKCRDLFARNKNLLVFPEGARARSGRLQSFKILAFRLALQTGLPVMPVLVHSTLPFMAKVPGSFFPRGRNEYRICFLDPEYPRPDDDAESLCDRVHRRMAHELGRLDQGTVWENKL
jgi:1-acyl-sn-glycerol-3-phosphate acyltransferase